MATQIERSVAIEDTVMLFKYLRELAQLKAKPVMKLAGEEWHHDLSGLQQVADYVSIGYRDKVDPDSIPEEESEEAILRVGNPLLKKCPEPDAVLDDWLNSDWDDPSCQSPLVETRSTGEDYVPIGFTDDPLRVAAAEDWLQRRAAWVEDQKTLQAVRDLFVELYEQRSLLENNSESYELMIGAGFITDRDSQVDHPIFSKRVKIVFDKATDVISIVDTDAKPELNVMLLASLEGLSDKAVNEDEALAIDKDLHPMDRNDTPDFLKSLAHKLGVECSFSDKSKGEFEDRKSRYLVYMRRALYLRKKPDGAVGAINGILRAIDDGAPVPKHLQRIVAGGVIATPDYTGSRSEEEIFAEVGGESKEILLTKEANREQLEIARRIDDYDAVLVQGPPGTGKTHTIANLMGHFLAQGKSVLVTSYTRKALAVLKDKLDEEMQGLCVSMLDDSHEDMARSVERIGQMKSRTSSRELEAKASELVTYRELVISELWKTRNLIFESLNSEYSSIVYQGESMTPAEAARYVYAERELSEVIPGNALVDQPIPLTHEEMRELYLSNRQIATDEEREIELGLPSPDSLMPPDEFSRLCRETSRWAAEVLEDSVAHGWNLLVDSGGLPESVSLGVCEVSLLGLSKEPIDTLLERLAFLRTVDDWQIRAIADAKKGPAHKSKWTSLIASVKATREKRDAYLQIKGIRSVSIPEASVSHIEETLAQAMEQIEAHGKISRIWLMTHRGFDMETYEKVLVDGQQVTSSQEFDLVQALLRLTAEVETCAKCWNDLMAGEGIPSFEDLDAEEPERIAENYLSDIGQSLDWGVSGAAWLDERLSPFGLEMSDLYESSRLDSERADIEKRRAAISETLLPLLELMKKATGLRLLMEDSQSTLDHLQSCPPSKTREAMLGSLERRDDLGYRDAYERLGRLVSLENSFARRRSFLLRLKEVAPGWAAAIVAREGIHGGALPPENYEEAWKWRYVSARLDEICEASLPELQQESAKLGNEYRRATRELASARAWESLLRRTESDTSMSQALEGWAQTVKKIGKGTGKKAPMLRAIARGQMAKCQNAVPAWIMTINDALTSLDPKENRFDVVIVDEASQAGISALPILFLAKKAVIVGDDNQVSPVPIGLKDDEVQPLIRNYLSGNVSNDHLYTADTSLYDIAKTTFKPLMLKEHFRCVPDIIGFSNMLSYDYQIKPLRDAGSTALLPAVVSQRAAYGRRMNKINTGEIEEIVCLMRACMDQPEYEGKTFGVISLFSGGGEQVKRMSQEVTKRFTITELEERKFLCGNAADFQGDERDVIFLSMVDGRQDGGPLSKMAEGPLDSYKKLYNVAVSRARDQVWIVSSLDWKNDLKPGDLRRRLLEYADNPDSFREKSAQIERESESPFEEAVAKALVARGFDIVQQWKAGAYRIDMVAQYGNARVAIECDGERFHSSADQIRNDMERQIILERAGWRFVRLRGSEYYRDPKKAMAWLVSQLTDLGIEPAERVTDGRSEIEGALLNRVREAAEVYRNEVYKHRSPLSSPLDLRQGHAEEHVTAAVSEVFIDESANLLSHSEPMLANDHAEQVESPLGTDLAVATLRRESATKVDSASVPRGKSSKTEVSLSAGNRQGASRSSDWVCEVLKASGVPYIDKRDRGGNLWVVDERQKLAMLMEGLAAQGARFNYKQDGGRVTKGKPGWWLAGFPERKTTLF